MRRPRFDYPLLGYLYILMMGIYFISGIYSDVSVQETMAWKLWGSAFYLVFLALYFLVANRLISIKKYITLRRKFGKILFVIGCFSILGAGMLTLFFKKHHIAIETPWIDLALLINIVSMALLRRLSRHQRKKGFIKILNAWLLSSTLLLVIFYQITIFCRSLSPFIAAGLIPAPTY